MSALLAHLTEQLELLEVADWQLLAALDVVMLIAAAIGFYVLVVILIKEAREAERDAQNEKTDTH